MAYKNNIPQPGDFLSDSQAELLENFSQLDTTFGIEHYTYSNLTADVGFHNKVTTPGFVTSPPTVPVVPPTTTTYPVFYGFEPLDAGGASTTNLGLLQYSRPPGDEVPTPVTHLQSPSTATILAANTPLTVFDFTGLARALCMLYVADTTVTASKAVAFVTWTGGSVVVTTLSPSSTLTIIGSGSLLRINSTAGINNVYWTLDFLRVQ